MLFEKPKSSWNLGDPEHNRTPININFQSLHNSRHNTLSSLSLSACASTYLYLNVFLQQTMKMKLLLMLLLLVLLLHQPIWAADPPASSPALSPGTHFIQLSLFLSSFGSLIFVKLLVFSYEYDSFPFWILTTKLLKQGRSSITGIIKW